MSDDMLGDRLFLQKKQMSELERRLSQVIFQFQSTEVSPIPHALVTVVLANLIGEVAARAIALEDQRTMMINQVYARNQLLESKLDTIKKGGLVDHIDLSQFDF